MEDEFEEETRQLMGELEDMGIMKLVGVDADGEFTYTFDMERLRVEVPELYAIMLQDLDDTLMDLYDKGLVEVEFDENLETTFHISDEGLEVLRENGYGLDDCFKRR